MLTDLLDITLTNLAYGGDAIGRLEDGRAVFVPYGLPGERVRIRLTDERGHFVRGVITEVLAAAAERSVPRCRHFGTCGGCHYQHMAYARPTIGQESDPARPAGSHRSYRGSQRGRHGRVG